MRDVALIGFSLAGAAAVVVGVAMLLPAAGWITGGVLTLAAVFRVGGNR